MSRWITSNLGDGYRVRAKRIDVGQYAIVAVEFMHPNYGYYADHCLFVKSLHMEDWEMFSIATIEEKHVKEFLRNYPCFSKLFEKPAYNPLTSKLEKRIDKHDRNLSKVTTGGPSRTAGD